MSGYFDMHCDTLAVCLGEGMRSPGRKSLVDNALAIDIRRGRANSPWVQAFGAFVHDSYAEKGGDEGFNYFCRMADYLARTIEENPALVKRFDPFAVDDTRCNAMLTVEGGAAISGKVAHIEELKRRGVRVFSLVWSLENELAGGINSESGLKPAGRDAVKELARCGIVLDVSHINEKGFWQVCEETDAPFIATHSNARAVCDHPRNLRDEQIKEIVRRGGLIGLTYCLPFVHTRKEKDATYEDLAAHIDHILSLGGGDVMAFGSDFDGAEVPLNMQKIEQMPGFVAFLEKRYGADMARKISVDNALAYFKRHWND